jgi:hypothetical protein
VQPIIITTTTVTGIITIIIAPILMPTIRMGRAA